MTIITLNKKEWEHFIRVLMNDIKTDKKSNAPKWINIERVGDFVMLKVKFLNKK